MNSYQKLKQQNNKLLEHIYTLVMKPDSIEAKRIEAIYRFDFIMDDYLIMGDESACEIKGITK